MVSVNLCTDQMAMLIAAPEQLHSVSHLAIDPAVSVLADQARGYAVNHGLAEEIFLMQPDLVIAGTYTTQATVDLLRKLGIRVETFAPENSFDDIRANLARMGAVLGQRERASELIAALDRELARFAKLERSGMTVAAYYANSYTAGGGTLVDAIFTAAGLTNIATGMGYVGTEQLPLELLVLAKPDLIANGGGGYDAPALADENFRHPAYRALTQDGREIDIPARYTICGAPFTVEAVKLLSEAAKRRGASQ